MRISSVEKCFVLILFLLPVIGLGQVKVVHMDAGFKPDKGGVVYSLPRTLIRIDVLVEKKELLAGPLRNFAEQYLGITNYINTNSFEYTIKDVSISAVSEPDPDQYYYISIEPKTSRETWQSILNLNGNGLITSLNTSSVSEGQSTAAVDDVLSADEVMQVFSKYADLNLYKKVDTVAKTIHLDTLTFTDYTFHTSITDKPLKVRAEEAARMILKIRDSRYNLLTGYQEINYSEGALKFMNEELLMLEQEYLRLFVGASVSRTLHYSFVYLPTPEGAGNNIPVFKLSRNTGIQEGGSGENVSVRLSVSGSTGSISSVEIPSGGLPYRLPELAEVKLFHGASMIAQARIPVSQFGKLASLPVGASEVSFDENTGGLTKVKLVAE